VRFYVATKNAGKLDELQDLLAPYRVEVRMWDRYEAPEESAQTYAGNAAIKARALRDQLAGAGVRGDVLADDSGLEINALGGRPGVESARYLGSEATWEQRRASLLREVAQSGSRDRGARFVCCLWYISSDGKEHATEGVVRGELSKDERGELGFAYDPIFYDPAEHATYGELSEVAKNKISHRGKAVRRLMEYLNVRAQS
jgi:XTP/dITP diphosphohydrolase